MRTILKIIFLLFIQCILLLPASTSAAYTRLLWERDLAEALTQRDDYFQKIGIVHDSMAFTAFLTASIRNSFLDQLALHVDPLNPWYHFLTGAIHVHTSESKASSDFSQALACAEDNPGLLWLLFYEFRQAKQKQLAITCLQRLEKYFLSIGAQSASVISQQLLALALHETKRGSPAEAETFFDWSSRFERPPFWQVFSFGVSSLPHHPIIFMQSCFRCLGLIGSSWLLQATLLQYGYQWLRSAAIAFIIMVLCTLSIEKLPTALHPITSLFPKGMHARFRWTFTFALYLSMASFGIFPFLFMTTIILWFRVSHMQKVLLSFVLGLLVLSPLDARLQSMFNEVLSPNKTLGLLRQSVTEGWHNELEQHVQQNAAQNPDNFLAHTAVAICALKKNDLSAAQNAIKLAESLQPLDPVVLTTAGNCHFAQEDTKSAMEYYRKSIDHFPKNASTLFNLGQLNISLMNTTEGMKQMAMAAEYDPALINTFLEKNATFFSHTWPRLRQFIQPEYTARYFWITVFPYYCGSWKNAAEVWGPAMLGMSPLTFLVTGIVLFIILLSSKIQLSGTTNTSCKLCGNPICHECRVGPVCSDCARSIEHTKDEMTTMQIKNRIVYMKHLKHLMYSHFLGIVFPGAGKLYNAEYCSLQTCVLFLATSCIYASYTLLLTATFSIPYWIVSNLFISLFLLVSLYPLFFTVQSIRSFFTELKILRGTHGTPR